MAITRGTMRTQIRRRIGDDGSTNFYATAFINDVIDSRVLAWAGTINRHSPNYYMEHQTITGVDDASDSDNEFYEYASDFRTFVKLERRFGSGSGIVYQTVLQVNSEDQDKYRVSGQTLLSLPDSLSNIQQTVSHWDNRLRIVPAPADNSYIYRLKYLRRPENAGDDNDNLDIPDQWAEVIRLASTISVLSRTSDDSSDPLIRNMKQLLAEEEALLDREYKRNMFTSIKGIGPLESF